MAKQVSQLKLSGFPSEPQKEMPRKRKEIRVTSISSVAKFDRVSLFVEFRLIPSKIVFSKLRFALWFDGQEITSVVVRIPQRFGDSNEFQLKSELDMRGISAGAHTVKVELQDLFSPCFGFREEIIDYVPVDRKAAYREIPIVRKIEGESIIVVSESEKKILKEIRKAMKKDIASSRDEW